MFHRIAIWRVFAMLDFSTFQRNPPKPAIPRVSQPRFGFEVACISVQCDVELRQRADANAQAPTPLKALAAVFRADSNPLSLVRKDRPAGGHSRGVCPSPKNFRKILDLSTRASPSGHGVVVLTNVTREKALARERANTSAALELTPSS
jgi:hypothetical protein